MITPQEIVAWIVGGLIIAVVAWLFISIPAFIGKARRVSSAKLLLIRLLAGTGVLFAFVTLVAFAILAGLYGLPKAVGGVFFILFIAVGGIAWTVSLILACVFFAGNHADGIQERGG